MSLVLSMLGDEFTIISIRCIECNGEMQVIVGADYSGICNECEMWSEC